MHHCGTAIDEAEHSVVTEVLCKSASLLPARLSLFELSVTYVRGREVVVSSDQIGDRIGPAGEGDALLELGETVRVARHGSRRPDIVEGVGPKIGQSKLLGHPERLAPEFDRPVVSIGKHLVA